MEGRLFVLRDFLHLAVQFRGGCLINTAGIRQAAQAHRLQHAQHSGSIHIGSEFRHIKADLHMALRGQIVDFIGTHLADHRHKAHGIAQIAVMEMEMRTALQMCDTFPVIHRGTADDAVYVIAFFQQKFRQIAAILTGHAGD